MTIIDEVCGAPAAHGVKGDVEAATSAAAVGVADRGGTGPASGGSGPPDLTDVAPDAGLAAVLASLEPAELDDYQLVEAAAAFQRMAAWANAKLAEVADELSRRPALTAHGALPSEVDAGNMAADELAPRLGLSRWAARRLVRNGRCFTRQFHPTGQALLVGEIDVQKATTIVTLLEDYPAELAFRVQEEVLPDAGLQTHSQLVAAIRKAVIALAHDEADLLHAKARAKRRVDHPRQLPDGMASLLAILPATDAVTLDLALETAARTARQNGDGRTLDQLRADTLSLMGHAALENGYVGIPPASTNQAEEADQAASVEQADRARPVESAKPGEPAEPAKLTKPAEPGETVPPAGPSVPVLTPPDNDDGADDVPVCPTAARTFFTCCDGTGTCATAGAPPAAPPGAGSNARSQGTAVPAQGTAASSSGTGGSGGAFLRRPHMRLGQISGGRARINITVPLSVLLPPDIAHQLGLPARTAPPGDTPQGASPPAARAPGTTPSTTPPTPPTDDSPVPTGAVAELVPLPEDDVLLALLEREPVEVAELEGYGPISPAVARAAALGGSWRRLVTDPLTGIVLDHGRKRYRPPADLAELVRLRDGTCVRAGCSSPARNCEIDHGVAWGAGGTTALVNLDNLCGRDHLIKTDGAFTIRHLGGGTFDWTTPTGHVYRRHRGGRVTFRGEAPIHAARAAQAQTSPF